MKVTAEHLQEQRDYYALIDEARKLGVPTSLDDPRTPKTVAATVAAIRAVRS